MTTASPSKSREDYIKAVRLVMLKWGGVCFLGGWLAGVLTLAVFTSPGILSTDAQNSCQNLPCKL